MCRSLLIFVCLFYFLFPDAFAQSIVQKLDSLEKVVDHTEGAEKLKLVMRLAEGYTNVSLDKAQRYAQEGYVLAMSSGKVLKQVQAFDLLGKVHYRKGNYRAAESCFRKALPIAEATGNPKAISILCNSMGCLLYTSPSPRDS